MKNRKHELTRFDFDVFRFVNSEDVIAMSAEEIGEYLLLLCESWTLNKNCTLPNDPRFLARIARVREVSSLVLKKFDLLRNGRLRNRRLFSEWRASLKRSESARKSALVRFHGKDANAMRTHSERNAHSIALQYKEETPAQNRRVSQDPAERLRRRQGKDIRFREEQEVRREARSGAPSPSYR